MKWHRVLEQKTLKNSLEEVAREGERAGRREVDVAVKARSDAGRQLHGSTRKRGRGRGRGRRTGTGTCIGRGRERRRGRGRIWSWTIGWYGDLAQIVEMIIYDPIPRVKVTRVRGGGRA